MEDGMALTRRSALCGAAISLLSGGRAMAKTEDFSLEGTWEMDSAYETLADGTRVTNYGEHPAGLLMVDSDGRYTLQIFRRTRPKFASGDKTSGTSEEYREAVLGSSTHFGRARVDAVQRKLMFDVEAASYPNWEGKQQIRDYTYENGLLTYQVPASASGNGTIAYSIWRRVSQ
jgi:Lipocalin-like domain